MDYDSLRNILARMVRGEQIRLPHPTDEIYVDFTKEGMFELRAIRKGDKRPHATSSGYKSLHDFVNSILYYFKPKEGYVYQHTNGNTYTVIAIANELSQRSDYPPSVVYKGTNGNIWVKPLENFMRKMTRIK